MEVDGQTPADLVKATALTQRTRGETIHAAFSSFRVELDNHYDRRERIVKISRDVTAQSKKLIFALHRITSKSEEAVFAEADGKMKELRALFEKLQGEVEGENFWRYQKSVAPGIEEYLEGVTFYHYLLHGVIPSLSTCQESLLPPVPPLSTSEFDLELTATSTPVPTPRQPYVLITPEEYLGGVADLTGELMRLAINSVGGNLAAASAAATSVEGGEEKVTTARDIESIGKLVRDIKGEMDPLAGYTRWLPKKLTVLDQSLSKIESASYALRIRGAEFQSSPAAMAALARSIAAGDGGGGGGGGGESRARDEDE